MGNEAQLKEKVERSENKNNNDDNSNKVSNEVQDEMRRQSLEKKDGTVKKTDGTNTGLQDVEIIDFSTTSDSNKPKDGSKVTVEDSPLGGQRILIESADGRTAQADYDSDGNMTSYRDFNGKKYDRNGDHFVNRNNPVQQSDNPAKDGVDIKVDKDTGTVELTDRSTGIKRSTDSNGVETADYSANGGGKTMTETKGNTETITIESVNRQQRKLVIEHTETGARVQEYTDGQGNKYRYTGVIDEKGKPIYSKDGDASNHQFHITADRSGNVIVRDKTLGVDNANYARRELNNGTIVTSSGNKDDGSRVILDAYDRPIVDGTPEEEEATSSKMIQEVPPNVDLKANAEAARKASAMGQAYKYYWFNEMVKTGGPWDYKSLRQGDNLVNKEYEDFGNWHFGYVGDEAGIPSNILQQRAGVEQIKQETSKPKWGQPSWGPDGLEGLNPFGGSGTYGDDPHDNEMIKKGIANREQEREQEVADRGWTFSPILV